MSVKQRVEHGLFKPNLNLLRMLARHRMRLEQKLEHVFYVISMENHAPSFVMSALSSREFHDSWNMASVRTMRNHAPPVLKKVE